MLTWEQRYTLGSWSSPFHCTIDSTRRQGFGEDTLQELAEKKQFFAALEAGRLTPVDYAVLNRQLTLSSTGPIAEAQTRDLHSQQSTPLTLSTSSVASSTQKGGSSPPVPATEQEGPALVEVAGLYQGRSSQSVTSYGSDTFESGDETSEVATSHTPSTETQHSPRSDVRRFDLSLVSQKMSGSDALHSMDVIGPPASAQETSSKVVPPQSEQSPGEDSSRTAELQGIRVLTSGVQGVGLPPVRAVGMSGRLAQPVQPGEPGPKAPSRTASLLHEEGAQASPAVEVAETQDSLSELSSTPELASGQHSTASAPSSSPKKTGEHSQPLQPQSSIEQDLEEVQQALKAAGLDGLDAVGAPTHSARSADLQLVLRELAAAEVVSLSQELLHRSWGVESGARHSPVQGAPPPPLPIKRQQGETRHSYSSSSHGATASVTGGSETRPQRSRPNSSKLPVATRRLPGSGAQVGGASAQPVSPSVSKEDSSHARESKLLEEVSRWQEMWQSEKAQRERVERERAALEVESRQRQELARLNHQDEIQRLKEELFTVSRKVGEQCSCHDRHKHAHASL